MPARDGGGTVAVTCKYVRRVETNAADNNRIPRNVNVFDIPLLTGSSRSVPSIPRPLPRRRREAKRTTADPILPLRNLSVYLAANEEEALNYLFLGDTNRAISETAMNKASSRSHCIFTVGGGRTARAAAVSASSVTSYYMVTYACTVRQTKLRDGHEGKKGRIRTVQDTFQIVFKGKPETLGMTRQLPRTYKNQQATNSRVAHPLVPL